MKAARKPFKIVGTVCVAAGLISTWDAPTAHASQSFYGEITPTHDLTAVYFLFAAGPCAPAYSKKIADFIPANTTTAFNITLNSITPASYIGDRFTIVALYDSVNGGVSLGFDPTQGTNILATSPAPDFNGSWTIGYGSTGYNGSGVDESVVAAALQSGTYNGVSLDDSQSGGLEIDPNASVRYWIPDEPKYYSQISTNPSAPAAFTLINFSAAAYGGSGFILEVVPPTLESSPIGADGAFQLTVSGPASSTIIQASTNLANWTNIYTNTPPFTFTDSMTTIFPSRYYRAQVGP
jgi:hypothetical protein